MELYAHWISTKKLYKFILCLYSISKSCSELGYDLSYFYLLRNHTDDSYCFLYTTDVKCVLNLYSDNVAAQYVVTMV